MNLAWGDDAPGLPRKTSISTDNYDAVNLAWDTNPSTGEYDSYIPRVTSISTDDDTQAAAARYYGSEPTLPVIAEGQYDEMASVQAISNEGAYDAVLDTQDEWGSVGAALRATATYDDYASALANDNIDAAMALGDQSLCRV